MRVLMKMQIPVEGGNAAIKNGSMATIFKAFTEQVKPEAAYFTVADGKRTMFAVFDLASPADMPRIGEPFFMGLGASIEVTPCMNAQELAGGLGQLG